MMPLGPLSSSPMRRLIGISKCYHLQPCGITSKVHFSALSSHNPLLLPLPDHSKPVLITTPIFYVNASPHLGHVFSALLADVLNRWYKLIGCKTYFSTGTDEHGLKVEESARAANVEPQQFCDEVSGSFVKAFQNANIQYDRFIRTTDRDHKETVEKMWKILETKGLIQMGTHEGFYCVSDESFVPDSLVKVHKDGKGGTSYISLESGKEVIRFKEENYMFDLPTMLPAVREYCKNIPESNLSAQRRAFLLNMVDELQHRKEKLSVSRHKDALSWGIRVPGNKDHVVYVWLDALVNYLTVANKFQTSENQPQMWPADYHIIGKDILKFHAIYWPAFLFGSDIQLPHNLVTHGHWLVNGKKMSKSLGNGIDPCKEIGLWGQEQFRFYLMQHANIHGDSDYSQEALKSELEALLVNVFGNLVVRSVAPKLNKAGRVPKFSCVSEGLAPFRRYIEDMNETVSLVDKHYRNVDIPSAINATMERIRDLNVLFQEEKPWLLAKDPSEVSKKRLEAFLYLIYEVTRNCSLLLSPIMPIKMGTVLNWLNIERELRTGSSLGFGKMKGGQQLKHTKGEILFNKYE